MTVGSSRNLEGREDALEVCALPYPWDFPLSLFIINYNEVFSSNIRTHLHIMHNVLGVSQKFVSVYL